MSIFTYFFLGYLDYAVAAVSEDETIPHIHMALGTSKSIKKTSLAKKLGLTTKEAVKQLCHQYRVEPVYSTSTPERNAEYVRKHKVFLDKGKDIPNVPMELINLSF